MYEYDSCCDNCNYECSSEELKRNDNGFCDACNRWIGCKHSKDNPCIYENDPCHYLCRECRDGNNFEPDITMTKEYLMNEISKSREYINDLNRRLRDLMRKDNKYDLYDAITSPQLFLEKLKNYGKKIIEK